MVSKKSMIISCGIILIFIVLFFSGCIFDENKKPEAMFTMEPSEVTIETPISFKSLSSDPDGIITNYTWKHNEELIGYTENITYTFMENGTHLIKLRVVDDQGDAAEYTKTILLGDSKLYEEKLIGEWEWQGNNQTGQWIFYENNTLKSIFTGMAGATNTVYWKWEMWVNSSQLLFSDPSEAYWDSAIYDFEFQDDFSTLKITYDGSTAYWYKIE